MTGGVVVRGGDVAAIVDRYIYGDYCSGTIWTIPADRSGEPRREDITLGDLVSIDAAADGTVFLTSLSGAVRRITAGG